MLKNGFLTLCFAFVPGAGQMYQGYMKRGFSVALLFAASVVAAALVPVCIALVPVIYMYSFFDALDLRAKMKAGEHPEDVVPFGLDKAQPWQKLSRNSYKIVGWVFVGLGVYSMYNTVIMRFVWYLRDYLGYDNPWASMFHTLMDSVPQVAVALGLIYLGWRMVRKPMQDVPALPSWDEEQEGGN